MHMQLKSGKWYILLYSVRALEHLNLSQYPIKSIFFQLRPFQIESVLMGNYTYEVDKMLFFTWLLYIN